MNKKIFLLLFLGIFISINSFGQNRSKNIIGIWYNYSSTIDKINQLADSLFKKKIKYLENEKIIYFNQMKVADDSTKLFYKQIIDRIDNQLNSITVDSVKDNILKGIKFDTFAFDKGKSLTIKNTENSVIANWIIIKDSLKLTIKDNSMSMYIKKISNKKMILQQNNEFDSVFYNITYYFEKK